MIVVFPYWGLPPAHNNLVGVMIDSVRRSMPGIEIYQQSDEVTPRVDGVDGVIRKRKTGDFIEHRFSMMSELDEDAISLDYDVVVQKDLRHVFDDEFDLAFTLKPDAHDKMKLNSGVMFTRSSGGGFWNEVLAIYEPIKDGWLNGQLAKYRASLKTGFKIKYLSRDYNYSPDSEAEDVSDKLAVHYKGARKEWMALKYIGSP